MVKKKGKVTKKIKKIDAEIEKLKKDLGKLKKKGATKKHLSEYNLFIRKQLKQGRTFAQAVRLWKRQQKVIKTLRKKPRKKPAKKKPKPKRKPAKKKPKKKIVKAKAKIKKKRPVKKKVKKKAVKKKPKKAAKKKPKKKPVKKRAVRRKIIRRVEPVIVEKPILQEARLESLVSRIRQGEDEKVEKIIARLKARELPDEEIAFRLARLYFEQVARTGFKRSLGLDELINAYLYSLARVKRQEHELKEIVDAVKRSKIKKSEF